MRIAIFGAGAIGGLLAARLAAAGSEVTVIARGAHLAAMRQHGLVVRGPSGRLHAPVRAVAAAEEAGEQDAVFVTTKAHAMVSARAGLAALMGEHALLVTAINGIPYWYFHGVENPFRGRAIESVDPGGALLRDLNPGRAVGCVVYPAAEVTAPGEITHTYGDRFVLGEPDGSASARVGALAEALIAAGFKAPIRQRIRDDIWMKLVGNLAFNPISALTGALLDRVTAEGPLCDVARAMMAEAQAVAEALGARFAIPIDKRIEGAREVGAHKPSMLQDLERGRPLETEALLGAPVELGALVGHPMPLCRAILALLRERGRAHEAAA